MTTPAVEHASVLVVDDNPLIVNVLKSLLASQQYHVYVSGNGSEALNVLTTKNVDVIICDVMMPKMGGYELHHAVRERAEFAHIPFVFLTALSDSSEVNKGMESGVDDYVVKPFDPEQLLAVVRGKVVRSRNLKNISEEQYDAYRKRVIHTLSHEFRTPLVAINTGTELLLEQKTMNDAARAHNLLQAIQRGGMRLERLVNDFMLLQQIEAGIARRVYESRAQVKVVTDSVSEFLKAKEGDYKKDGFAVSLNNHAEGVKALFYEAQIYDILDRLMGNAIKFSGKTPAVEVWIMTQEGEVLIEVRDRGIGIDVGRVREAIDVFGQLDRDRLEQQGGGLGLAIANRYAKINKGRLEFDNRDGGGSIVSLILPKHDAHL